MDPKDKSFNSQWNTAEVFFDDTKVVAAVANASEQDLSDQPEHSFLFDKLPFYIILVLVFLLPLVFAIDIPLTFVKSSLVDIVTAAIFILWALSSLKKGSFFWTGFKENPMIVSSSVLMFVILLSSLFSGFWGKSFLGDSLDIGTGVSVMLGTALFLFVSRILKTKEQMFSLYVSFFSSAILLGFFQILRTIFGPDFLSFGVFTALTSVPIGKWNEMAIIFGLVSVLIIIALESFKLGKAVKWISIFLLVMSLFVIALVDFSYVISVLGIFSLIVCLYYYLSKSSGKKNKKVMSVSLFVLVFLVLLTGLNIWGGSLRAHLPSSLRPMSNEVSPTLSNVLVLAKDMVSTSTPGNVFGKVLLGVGPNRFANEWVLNKPLSANLGTFGNIDFAYGSGLVPTFLITSGLLGLLAWFGFFVSFIWLGYKKIFAFNKFGSFNKRYLTVSSFFGALYLWVFSVLYVPTGVILAFAFIFTGVFVASLYDDGELSIRPVAYASNKKIGFAIILVLILAIIASIDLIYVTADKLAARHYFERGVSVLNSKGDMAIAADDIKKAASLDGLDSYYRTLVDIDMSGIGSLVSQKNLSQSAMQAQFQTDWAGLMSDASKAMDADKSDYQNYLLYGNIYQSVISLGYPNAYEYASAYYAAAAKIDPTDPIIPMSQAQLELQNNSGNTQSNATTSLSAVASAQKYIAEAIRLKPDYTAAIYLLAEIEVNQGDYNDAIRSISSIASITPSDPTVFFQLGYLEYSIKAYQEAILAFDKAISIESDYSNARYFLGLSDYYIGDINDAISQFSTILNLNPDNQDVKSILSDLRSGKAPLTGKNKSNDQTSSPNTTSGSRTH